MQLVDTAEIIAALAILLHPGQLTELRVLDGVDRPGGRLLNRSGYFDDPAALARELSKLSAWHGVYITPNPVDPILAGRTYNRLDVAQRGESTTDANIVRRRWLLVDFDPAIYGQNGVRVRKIAATDAERERAIDLARRVADDLAGAGWPRPLIGDSGNGAHLLYRVDLPHDSPLPEQWLKALAARYTCDTVEVDTTVYNAARIWKLYGTLACKGSNIADRPWRMARLIDIPIGGAELVSEAEIAAYIAAAAPANPPAPAAGDRQTIASPPPRSSGDRSPAGDGQFDAFGLIERAGYRLGPAKPMPGGGEIREFETCPCSRQLGDRAAFVTVAPSGGVGLACQHATCENSRGKGTPGELWRQFRTKIDPTYGAAPAGPTTAERRAAAAGFASQFAAPTADGLDLSGMVAPGAAPAAPRPPAPRAPTATDGEGGRLRVNVHADLRDLRDQVLAALARCPAIYVSQGRLARVDAGYRMEALTGGGLDSAVVDVVEAVKYRRDRETDKFTAEPDALPTRVLKMLEQLAPAQVGQFRVVEQISRAPVCTPAGQIVTTPGYSADARTLIVDCPQLDLPPVAELALPDALSMLRDGLADFPFEGGIAGPEADTYLGMLLVPLVRPLIRGPVPLLLIEANRQGTGKSLLAQILQIIYGLPAEMGRMAKDEVEFAKALLSILDESKVAHTFDNVKHTVTSAALDAVLTSETYTDRLLGGNQSRHVIVRTLFILTSNNAKFSQDMARRTARVRIRSDVERPEERTDIRQPGLTWPRQRRAEILAALVTIVQAWLDAGRPVPAGLPVMGSFESFCEVIGSIMYHAGARNWLGNLSQTKATLTIDDEWLPFLIAWSNSGFPARRRARDLVAICNDNDLLGNVLGDGGDVSRATRLSNALLARRDQVMHGYRIDIETDGRTGRALFSLTVVDEARRQSWLH